MWNEILGTLAIVAMVYLCMNASQLTAAMCDRIRYGVQSIDETEPDPEASASTTAAPVGKTVAPAKPVSAKAAA